MRRISQALVAGAAFTTGVSLASGQATTRVSVDSGNVEGNANTWISKVSSDGKVVVFESWATNLVPGDTNGFGDVFAHDTRTGVTEIVSVDSTGAQGNNSSYGASASSDGHLVAFCSDASNLVPGDTNATTDVFVRDRVAGTTERISVDPTGADGNNMSFQAAISADGNFVAFASYATNLVAGYGLYSQIYLRDRVNGITSIVSVDDSLAQAIGQCVHPAICADGHAIAFVTPAANLVSSDTNGAPDVYVRDLSTGHTERVSVDSAGAEGNGWSGWADPVAISDDGNRVAFSSTANNLVPIDTNTTWQDSFVRDRALGWTVSIDIDATGHTAPYGALNPTISGDGRFAACSSYSALLPGDTNGVDDVYVVDLLTGTQSIASVDSNGIQCNGSCSWASLSQDGSRISFGSNATNLVSGDTNGGYDVFVHENCIAAWSNYGTPFPGTFGPPALTLSQLPVLGSSYDIDLGNSLGSDTFGLTFVGLSAVDQILPSGAHVLVAPLLAILIFVPAGGIHWPQSLPDDPQYRCVDVYLQLLEADPGAFKGISFSQGLAMHLGY
jgi:Tol biopolymer transport system component